MSDATETFWMWFVVIIVFITWWIGVLFFIVQAVEKHSWTYAIMAILLFAFGGAYFAMDLSRSGNTEGK